MNIYIIVIDGKVTVKIGRMTFDPNGDVNVEAEPGDGLDINSEGEWYNYTTGKFWSKVGQQEYAAAVAEYETPDDGGTEQFRDYNGFGSY